MAARNTITIWEVLGLATNICPGYQKVCKEPRWLWGYLGKFGGDECFGDMERAMEMKLADWGDA